MFRLFANGTSRNCEGVSRRELLQVGTLGFGGLCLADVLRLRAVAAEPNFVKPKSVVVLNLQGGPTHIETFDPKMTAPRENRAMFGEVQTTLPGVTFGSDLPNLARLADRLAVVRSFKVGSSSHAPAAQLVMAGGNPSGANMGSLYARIAGVNNGGTGMPNCVVLTPKAAGEKFKKIGSNASRLTSIGDLPSSCKPFDPSAGGQIVQNMQLSLPEDRLEDRRTLLSGLDALRRRAEREDLLSGADRFQQQAFEVITGGISGAFDLSQESPETVARYNTKECDVSASVLKKKKKNILQQRPIALGHQMLLARRLVEAGAGFVTVTSAGWDMHGNAFGIDDGMPTLGRAMDRAASAFIEDIEQRGLSNDVLLVITGEFGRTPKINQKAGRDHWGNLGTLAFAGGGLRMGQVIGQSDRTASVPASEPVTVQHLLGTVMHHLFDIGELRLASGIPSGIQRLLNNAHPIPQLS